MNDSALLSTNSPLSFGLCGTSTGIAGSLRDLRQLVADVPRDLGFVYAAAETRTLLERAWRFAQTNATILITGESGTGKEVLARAIHQQSPRREQPYVTLNCAALSQLLVESELFGHENGAFTGAVARRRGWLEHAASGSLLLDEISEISAAMQAKLLRVLQEGEFHRVGGNETLRCQARFIATSNRSLPQEVRRGRFREDLYHRLRVLHLFIPPLRERIEDLPPLIDYFLARCSVELQIPARRISVRARQALMDHTWPGNVRELQHAIFYACTISDSTIIEPEHLPELSSSCRRKEKSLSQWSDMTLSEIERHVIRWNLKRFRGNKTAVARHLGVTPKTIAAKLNQCDASE